MQSVHTGPYNTNSEELPESDNFDDIVYLNLPCNADSDLDVSRQVTDETFAHTIVPNSDPRQGLFKESIEL